MSTRSYIRRILRINSFILKRATGSREELAQRLGVSVSTLHQTIKLIEEEFGVIIEYDATRKTYYYSDKYPDLIWFRFNTKDLQFANDLISLMKLHEKNALQ